MIAEANGYADDSEITAGTVVSLPNVTRSSNTAGTLKVYDPGRIIGDTNPEPIAPPPPPPNAGGGCGGLGMVLVIVVAVVVTVYTAGAAAGWLGAAGTTAGATGTAAIGGAALSGGGLVAGAGGFALGTSAATAVAAAAIGGAVGSIASQGVAMAMGLQDNFSWKQVGLGAIGAGVTAGMGQAGMFSSLGRYGAAAANAAAGNAITQGLAVATDLQDKFNWRAVATSAMAAPVAQYLGGQAGGFVKDMVGGSAGQMAGEFAQRMTAGVVSQRIRMAIYNQGKLDYAAIAADAFGNALGQGLVDAMKPSYSDEEMAGDFQREKNRLAAAAQAGASAQRPLHGFDDPMGSIDYSLASGKPVRLDGGSVESVADAASSESLRREQLARIVRLAHEPAAHGDDATFRVHISGLPTPDEYNAAQIQRASEKGWDLRPTAANAGHLELMAMDGGLSSTELAGRFGQGLLDAVKGVTVEPLLQVRDLGIAGASVAYNELFRSEGDELWLPKMKSGMAQSYAGGASQARLLLQSNPLTGIGVVSYDLTTATMNGDWGSVAEMGGGLVGGLAIGKGVSKYGGYSIELNTGAPGTVYSNPLPFKLVAPDGAEGLKVRLPHGFSEQSQFSAFGDALYTGLDTVGFKSAQAGFQGSSVTGRAFKAPHAPFDVGRVSDFDIALSSPELFAQARSTGIGLRQQGTRTGPLLPEHLDRLGLTDLNSQLSRQAGREVNFMIYRSIEDAISRSPTILVPRKP